MSTHSTAPQAPLLSDGDLTLDPTSGADGLLGWAIMIDGQRRGTVAAVAEGTTTWSLRWNVGTDPSTMGLAVRALQLTAAHLFDTVSATRLEARIPVDRSADIRAASIVGLRREGIVRGGANEPDRALMARLVDDPSPTSRDGFIALLNAGLPTKRVISQGVLRDPEGRVLLCQLTYKNEWDLPGGVVEVGESPQLGLQREIAEELGIDVEVRSLITVNWLPAWRGWDDACVFVFDLGQADPDIVSTMTFQPTEIAGVQWCDRALRLQHATAAANGVLDAIDAGVGNYREAPLSD